VARSLSHLSPFGAPHYVAVATIVGLISTVNGQYPEVTDDGAILAIPDRVEIS
jgi:hypothetical protein